jgi:hypothetical protein
MVGRLLAVGAAWLAAIALFAVLLQSSGRPTARGPAWRVVQANSAHHAMVMEVEADHLDDAPRIAEEIVEPLKPRGYEEVLIYFHHTGERKDTAPVRRFQWTPHGGFVEKDY